MYKTNSFNMEEIMAKRKTFKTLSTDETALVRGGTIQKDREHPWDSDAPTDTMVDTSDENPWDADEHPWDENQ